MLHNQIGEHILGDSFVAYIHNPSEAGSCNSIVMDRGNPSEDDDSNAVETDGYNLHRVDDRNSVEMDRYKIGLKVVGHFQAVANVVLNPLNYFLRNRIENSFFFPRSSLG